MRTFVSPMSTLTSIAEHEAVVFDLRQSETMQEGIRKACGVETSDIKLFQAEPTDKRLVIVFNDPNRKELIFQLEEDNVEWDDNDAFIYKLIKMVAVAGPTYHALEHHPDWYKYYVFSYITTRFDELTFVSRFTPEHFDPDYEITAVSPVLLQGEASSEVRLPRTAVERRRYLTSALEQDQGYGLVHPFIISGPYFAFNSIIPMPHAAIKFDPKEDLEAVRSRDVALYSY